MRVESRLGSNTKAVLCPDPSILTTRVILGKFSNQEKEGGDHGILMKEIFKEGGG